MNPVVESAWIAAAATFVGVGGAVAVAMVSNWTARRTNQAAIDAAHADAQLTLDTAREAQFADRYSRALEQIGSANLDVRIGGIYALEGIALDSPRHYPTVMEVLTAFIRGHSRPEPGAATRPEPWPLPDVLIALSVIGRREAEHDIRVMNLSGVDLAGADLPLINLSDVNLRGATLDGANLTGATLTGAYLNEADLSGADLSSADLGLAFLIDARLPGANFTDAKLSSAFLVRANLHSADFSNAELLGTNLTGADLTGANLRRAILSGTLLADADLTGAAWPVGSIPLPEGWTLDRSSTGRLARAADYQR